MLVHGAGTMPDRREWPVLPDGVRWAADMVVAAHLRPAIARALDRVAVVPSLGEAVDVVTSHPDVRAVTLDGDLVGPDWVVGGHAGAQSVLEIQSAADRAAADLVAVVDEIAGLEAALAGASADAGALDGRTAATLAELHESDARMSAVSEELARHGVAVRESRAEIDRLERQRATAEAAREGHAAAVADLEERLRAAESSDAPDTVDPGPRDELAARTAVARQREVDARLAVRTAEERLHAAEGGAERLRRAARQERQARERARQLSARRTRNAAVAAEVAGLARRAANQLEQSLASAAAERDRLAESLRTVEQTGATARAAVAELQAEWERLTDRVHAGEVVRAQQTLLAEQLAARALEEFAIAADDLVAGYGPDVPVPATAQELAEYQDAKERGEAVTEPQPSPYDRATQERRARRAERDLAALGKVNPLALEEFSALEERHAFLSTQLEDLKATRRDLMSVIRDVDEKILELFADAYHDVAREFRTVFATLFPGGEGELVLTDPSDMLATGIEVNARPPGKKVRRLSLLSGGERSLTAVAMLVAIFRARPSPFYVMDEVEAALDEVNLTRLVNLLTELRDSSQLIIITHQKFTMEAADALYGVSMRGDGITAVISQRIRSAPDAAVRPGAAGAGELAGVG